MLPRRRVRWSAMPRLPADRYFPAEECRDNIENSVAENLFESPVAGYSQLMDDSWVRFRIGEIIAQALSQPTKLPSRKRSR
jgi:hypothetical protein